jgi:glucokinase
MHSLSSVDDLTLSFDLGGSHIAAWYSKVPLAPQTAPRVLLDHTSPKEAILDAISRAGREALVLAGAAGEAVDSIAFATPGPFDYAVGTSQMSHKCGSILNYPLRQFLQKGFGAHPEHIYFLNDANAFLLGELTSVSQGRIIGLTLGTGIGSAFAVDGNLVQNGPGVPPSGEVFRIPWHGETIEDAISTRGILRLHHRAGGVLTTVRDIAETADQDAISAKTMHAFGRSLGHVINYLADAFHPDTIILGGSIAKRFETFSPTLMEVMTSRICTVRASTLLELAALAGAASCAQTQFQNMRARKISS